MTIFSQEFQLALSGELQAYLAKADEAVLQAAKAAISRVAGKGSDHLRAIVHRSGLSRDGAQAGRGTGRSLANAIRYEIYPKGARLARNPSALLYIQPSAVNIFESFEEGSTISGSPFLTIPVPGSPADRKNFGPKPRGETVLEKLKSRGIEIAFVKATANRPAMLVANNVRGREDARGRFRVARAKQTKAGGYAAGVGSIPLFFLIPRVQMPKRFDLAREFERLAAEFFEDFSREFAVSLARLESERIAA